MVHSFLLKTAALVSSTLLALTLLSPLEAANDDSGIVTLKHMSGSSAQVSLLGAQVISFRPSYAPDVDVLFLSTQPNSEGLKANRGGVAIVFPLYGFADGSSVPLHGFARSTQWTSSGVVPAKEASQATYAHFEMESTNATLKMWPYKFRLVYEVNLYSDRLESMFYVYNRHSESIYFNALLQNYLYVPDVRDNGVVISGLQGVDYYDRLAKRNQTETRLSFGITSQVENVYKNVKSDVVASIRGENFHQNVSVEASTWFGDGAHRPVVTGTDYVVSNPWKEGSKAEFGLRSEDYLRLTALGSGRVSEKQVLYPGLIYSLTQVIKVVRYNQ